jgi:nucleoside-diphosphate-sugar epimerase
MRSYCAILTDRAHPSAEIENYLVPQTSALYYADWFDYEELLFHMMNTQRLTEVRDYIHVVDLKAHVIALNDYCIKKNVAKVETFNLGTGTGSSVLVIKA